MSLFQVHEVDEDLRRESIDEPRGRTRMYHWCETCHGHTGPGSPCAIDDEPEPEDDSEFCPGCTDEPTVSELDAGSCDCYGKPFA